MKVMIFHASAGEGHRRAAMAVESALIRSGLSHDEIMTADALDYSTPFFKKSYTGFYYWCVKNVPQAWGFFYDVLDHPVVYKLFYPLRQLYNTWNGHRLLELVIEKKPQLVICTHFFSAEILGRAKKLGKISSKILVLVTDFHPARVWIHEGIDLFWVLSERGKMTLMDRGIFENKIIAGGFPIGIEFQRRGSKGAMLDRFQLEKNRLTILMTTGSFGLGEQMQLLELLESVKDAIQCLVVCGRNESLQKELSQKTFPYPVRVFGFVDFMTDLMDAADLMVAKPGGATTAEAMAKGLTMIATGAIPGQETENLTFLLEENAVFAAETPDEILKVIQTILKNRNLLDEKRRAMDLICNPRAAEDLAQLRLKWIPN